MEKPIIMVSSTYYDLKQIRNELKLFIENMGYESLLSESSTFPISPELNTLENCKKKVEIYTDILVLVIGGRYGSIDDRSGKSITNLEYIEARNKGIPIYVFIEKKILNYIDIWTKNKESDFSSVVDTVEVFEFIERIRKIDSVWTFPFEVVNDIKEALTIQFAYMFKSSLTTRLKLQKNASDKIFDTLSSAALLLVMERPISWEYRLFFQVWLDELELLNEKLYEYKYNIGLLNSEYIASENTISWIQLRLHEIQGYVDSSNNLLNVRAQEAFGPPGVPGNSKEIIIISKKLVRFLSVVIDWCFKLRLVKSEEPFTRVLTAMSKFPEGIISNMQEFPRVSLERIEKAVAVADVKKPQLLNFTLVFDLQNMDEFNEALSIAKKYYGVNDNEET